MESDIVEVYLDTYHDHLTAFVFCLTPLGAKRDATMNSTGGQDNTWDAIWEGVAGIEAIVASDPLDRCTASRLVREKS